MTIYCEDIASVIEAIYTDSDTSMNPCLSDTIVNPMDDRYIGKTLIFNCEPYPKMDLNKLADNNRIISRIPIKCDNYEFDPFDLDFTTSRIKFTSKAPKILSTFILKSTDFDFKKGILKIPRYRIVTGGTTNGYINIAGFLGNLMGITNSWKDMMAIIRDVTPNYKSSTKLFDKNSVYKYTLKSMTDTYDLCTDNNYYVGPMIRRRRPDKRMNVRNGYFYGKFKTYRITDKVRSLDINYNTRDGFHVFYLNKSELDQEDIISLALNGGLEFLLYLMFYFCKKNHFKNITGDVLTEPLSYLTDPDGMLDLNISLFPKGLVDDTSVFYLSVLGLSKNN